MTEPTMRPANRPGWAAGLSLGATEDGAAPLARALWQFFSDKLGDETPASWRALLRRLDDAEPARRTAATE